MTQYHQIFSEGERSINMSYKSRLNRKLKNVENSTFLRLANLCGDSKNVGRQYKAIKRNGGGRGGWQYY
jgi:hypothetical protein